MTQGSSQESLPLCSLVPPSEPEQVARVYVTAMGSQTQEATLRGVSIIDHVRVIGTRDCRRTLQVIGPAVYHREDRLRAVCWSEAAATTAMARSVCWDHLGEFAGNQTAVQYPATVR